MTLLIKMPIFEIMKTYITPDVNIPMEELIDARKTFILIWREPGSPLHHLPREIVVHILTCSDMTLIRVREKAFEKLILVMNAWGFKKHGGPEYIVLIDESGKEIANDQNLRDCLNKKTVISAVFKDILGKGCRAIRSGTSLKYLENWPRG